MNSITRLLPVVAGLVLLTHVTPGWGQPTCASPGCNPTATDMNGNTAGGTGALSNVVSGPSGGFGNTAFGASTLTATTTGSANTASGAGALANNITGSHNTASGDSALFVNAIGSFNSGTGALALFLNSAGNFNTATGFQSLFNNSSGDSNTASGVNALLNNITGSNNTASGATALASNTSANLNTATGFQALFTNVDGANNTAVGAKALKKSTGTKNIGIGYQAGVTLTTGNNNIFIGNQGVGDESQTIRIGTAQTQTFIAGIGNAGVSGAPVEVDTVTGQLGVVTSSARYKQDIAPMGTRSEKVLELRPVTFAYKNDAQGTTHYGLLAEEVATVYPELVTHTTTGEVQTVKYQELIPMLLNELQRQREALHHQQQELAELRALVGQGRGAEEVIPSATVAASGTPR